MLIIFVFIIYFYVISIIHYLEFPFHKDTDSWRKINGVTVLGKLSTLIQFDY